jgi:integration host factor subunit beta
MHRRLNNKSVTKGELAHRLRHRLPLLREDERLVVVDTMIRAITQALAEGRRVEIRDFGVFDVRRRGARRANNPQTGQKVFVPEKFVPFFRAGRLFQKRVNASGDDEEQAAPADDQR